MAYTLPPDVEQRVREKIVSGQYASKDEVLREALNALTEEEEDLVAIRQAIAEHQAGDEGVPLDEAFAAIRRKHQGSSPT